LAQLRHLQDSVLTLVFAMDRHALGDISTLVNDPKSRVTKALDLEDYPPLRVRKEEAQDPQRSLDYGPDIFERFVVKEALFRPKPDYMDEQQDVNKKMRAILVDWLVEVHMKYKMRPETLFLTVDIIDRYLSVRPIVRKQLQLLGVTAMLVASKYEEIDPPRLAAFLYITDNTYTKAELKDMEVKVLMTLECQIAVTTPVHVFDRLVKANDCDAVHRSFVQYILELALLDTGTLRHPPSMLVSASLLMSNEHFGRRASQLWPAQMVQVTGWSESCLRACADDLKEMMDRAKASNLQSVRKKYQLPIHHEVSNLPPKQGAR